MPDSRNQGQIAGGCRTDNRLFIETPQALKAATAASIDDQFRPVFRGQIVEACNSVGNLHSGRLALHAHGPDGHPDWKSVGQSMQHIADDRSGW